MKRKLSILIHSLLACVAAPLFAYDIPGFTPDQTIPFKQTLNNSGGAVTLNLHVFTPPGHLHQKPRQGDWGRAEHQVAVSRQ